MPTDVRDVEALLIARTLRPEPGPRPGLAERMIARAVSGPQRRLAMRRSGMRGLIFVGAAMIVGAVIGLSINAARVVPIEVGTGSELNPPLQELCAGFGSTDGCVHVSVGLPVSDFRPEGWNYRCQGGDVGSDCFENGREALLSALSNVGPPYEGVRLEEFGASGIPLRIEFTGDPNLRWSSETAEGESTHISVDLTHLAVGDGPAFALIGDPLRNAPEDLPAHELPDALARQILEAFFTPVE